MRITWACASKGDKRRDYSKQCGRPLHGFVEVDFKKDVDLVYTAGKTQITSGSPEPAVTHVTQVFNMLSDADSLVSNTALDTRHTVRCEHSKFIVVLVFESSTFLDRGARRL